jgi:hypothetical protein
MDIRKTYRMQQQYYNGFSFLPISSVKEHTYFVYKLYTKNQNMYPLFDCVLNKEVLDIYYIVNIQKAITTSSVPLSHAVLADLQYAQDAASLFLNESGEDHENLAYVLGAIRLLKRSLDNFGEVQEKLFIDLKNLISGHDMSGMYKASSEDITNIIEVLQQVCKGVQRFLNQLSEFLRDLPLKGKYRQQASMAKYCVGNCVEGLRRWMKVQESIVHQLEGWRTVRTLHERQEVLN